MSKVSFIKTLSEYSESVPYQDGAIITTSDKPGLAYCVGDVKRGMGTLSWGDVEVKKVPDYFFLSGKGLTDWPSSRYSRLDGTYAEPVFTDNITSYSIELKPYSSVTSNAVLCFSPMDLTSKRSIDISFNMLRTASVFVRLLVHSDAPKYDYADNLNRNYGTEAATVSSAQISSTAPRSLSLDISAVTGYWYVSLLFYTSFQAASNSMTISSWTIS